MTEEKAQRFGETAAGLNWLFSPIDIGKRRVKNRIVSTAHASGLAEKGLINEKLVRYQERKAQGGAGLIMTFGSASVYEKSAASYGSVSLWDAGNEPLLTDLAGRVHAHDALLISQATHMGRRANSRESGQPIQAPSAVPEPVHREIPQALRKDEIQEIARAFASSAARLESCGWDGIEITSYGGHLIEQFWSPTANIRTDEYGGDLNNRMRFSIEVLERVAEAVSEEFLVSFRLTGDPLTSVVGLDLDDMMEIATRLDEVGRVDLFNVSGGTGATFTSQAGTISPDTFERGCFNYLARKMKGELSVPVLAAGRILDPDQAEEALTLGDCDLVAMTRAIIADPDMPRLAKSGHTARIRPCTAINEGCLGRVYDGLPIACSVNAAIADDSLYDFAPSEERKRVVVVGGGPAGMEAARVAAERQHKVLLFERDERLGGQVIATAQTPDRPHYGRHVDWLERELSRLDVEVRLGTSASTTEILAVEPDAVILATGGETITPPEADGVRSRCVTDSELLLGRVKVEPGVHVLVYDAEGHRGGRAANFIAEAGASHVELCSPLESVCEDLDVTNKPPVYRQLAKNGVTCTPHQMLVGQRDGYLVLKDEWSEAEREIRDADVIVFAGHRRSVNGLQDELHKEAPGLQVLLVGDSISPRTLQNAVAEGVGAGNFV